MFDLVMTDWNMPNKNGLELLQEIRGGGRAVPVIMITTEAEAGRVKEAIEAGVNDYLAKPFENDVLAPEDRQVSQQSRLSLSFKLRPSHKDFPL